MGKNRKTVKMLKVVIMLFFTQTIFAQVQKDIFEVPTALGGNLSGTHYYVKGSSNKLILFSGAYNQYQDDYNRLAIKLASLGYHVVTYDLRGHAESTAPLFVGNIRKEKGSNPIYDQATHEGARIHHGEDLKAIYKYALATYNIDKKETIFSFSAGSSIAWSFEMVKNHSEVRKFIFLTGELSQKWKQYLKDEKDFDILSIQTEGEGHGLANTSRIKTSADKAKKYFKQVKNHNVTNVYCIEGLSNKVLQKCAIVENRIIDWVKKVNRS